jgi:diaminopimelate decarboxylase
VTKRTGDLQFVGAGASAVATILFTDVLIEAAELPEPRAGDVLAVPATGAYTLALG